MHYLHSVILIQRGDMQMKDQSIHIQLVDQKKVKPPAHTLEFGRTFTDHMFLMDYTEGQGWHDARIVPYAPLSLDPAAMVLHYGQTIFEGLKAYVTKDGVAQLFRPTKNIERLNRSNDRMCIPQVDKDFALKAIQKLVEVDQEWIPNEPGTSLYIRPFIFSTQPYLGVAASEEYTFVIILSPVGAYYKEGINPVKIAVEDTYVRTVAGGTGEAKTAGNYASSLKAQENTEKEGFAQVLWLDGVERKYIEEVGSMNVFFKIDGKIVTPELTGSILEGVTRNSVLRLLNHWDMDVEERKITIGELYEAHQNGTLEEAFGTGTAAVISPIGQLTWKKEDLIINNHETGPVAKRLYETLTRIQYGEEEDPFDWIIPVE